MATASQFATQPWTFNEARHEYRYESGLLVPSTTQTLKMTGFVDYEGVQRWILERKGELGKAVHAITEFVDTEMADCGEQDIDFETIAPEHQPRLQAWMRFKRESKVEILDVEKQFIAVINGMPIGMTYDRRARVFGREAVLEIKTSANREDWWGLQLAAYDLGMPQCENQLRRDRYAVQLLPDGKYRLWPFEDEGDYVVFPCALASTWWMLNHHYKID